MKKGIWVGKMVVLGVIAVGLFGWATTLLWNWLIPALFNGPVITFWQALGLFLLSKILFWSGGKGGHHQGGPWKHYYWKKKWNGMTPEEREAFKGKMKEKWCYKDPGTSAQESGTSNV